MINLDWFQPFDSSQYSVRAIYTIICNLSRNEQFKPSNILTLALIPGPNEPKLHQLNHYLAPLIDQLVDLWNGKQKFYFNLHIFIIEFCYAGGTHFKN